MTGVLQQAEIPVCPVCCERLGKYGGPSTLPCGHNGCLTCFSSVQARNSVCPLCRSPFDPNLRLSVNHELEDLVALATVMFVDESLQQEGWEAFPTHKATAEHYAAELVKGRTSHDAYPRKGGSEFSPSAPELGRAGSGSAGPSSGNGAAAMPDDVLLLEPPPWLPDSQATQCLNCHLEFRPFTRLRHHCRLCGKIYCNACCHKRMLLPPRYGQRMPQRVCELCSAALEPHQQLLASTLAVASQPPVLDAPDAISLRSWLNAPWASNLEEDVFKAANMLQAFTQAPRLHPEAGLPTTVLQGAEGLALLSVVKIGAGWSVSYGTGVLVSRTADGTWSAPCAVSAAGLGWGLQLGGELTDLLLVLRSREAVAALCGSLRLGLGLGGNASVALGPVGRHADASVMLTSTGATTAYSYSCSKGAFLGVSIESSVLTVRNEVNLNFYGFPVTPKQLLLDAAVPRPPAASLLYDGLQALMHKYENRGLLVHNSQTVTAATAASVAAAGVSMLRRQITGAVSAVSAATAALVPEPPTAPMTSAPSRSSAVAPATLGSSTAVAGASSSSSSRELSSSNAISSAAPAIPPAAAVANSNRAGASAPASAAAEEVLREDFGFGFSFGDDEDGVVFDAPAVPTGHTGGRAKHSHEGAHYNAPARSRVAMTF